MAFNDPPNILAGISHPQVISTPGAGEAMAGGLSAVLGAILQRQQLDQQHQQEQADLAQKQAQTQHELALAKLTDADTTKAQEDIKKQKKEADDLQQRQAYERVANSFVMAHPELATDSKGFWTAAHQAISQGALPQDILPQLGDAYGAIGKYTEQAGKALQEQVKGNVQQATQGSQIAAENLKPADVAAGIAQKRAEAGAAQALTATRQQDLRDAKQKAQDTEMQRYLLANDNDPMKAYAKYITDKKLANTPAGAAQGPALATQFMALSKSPVTGLKPAQINQAVNNFNSRMDKIGFAHRAEAYGLALDAIQSGIEGNKGAIGSIYNRYVQAVDQDKNLRYQMLIYLKSNIDPDLPNAFRKAVDAKFHGTIPPNVLNDMRDHMMSLAKGDMERYEAFRQEHIAQFPETDGRLPTTETTFSSVKKFMAQQGGSPTVGSRPPLSEAAKQIIRQNGKNAQGISAQDWARQQGYGPDDWK